MKKTQVLVGLTSASGDRLGHLVRGVQMLRSYGKEFETKRYSKVINVPLADDQLPALCALLTGESEANVARWHAMIKETQWALGDAHGSETLEVTLVRHGDQVTEFMPRALKAVLDHGLTKGNTMFLSAPEFRRLCAWGQSLTDSPEPVIGEWPSAVSTEQ